MLPGIRSKNAAMPEKRNADHGGYVLEVDELEAGYGSKRVVTDVSLRVGKGEIVAMVGHNGAGKTTTLSTIFGMLKARRGTVVYKGVDITSASCAEHVKMGISFLPSERFTFGMLDVRDNILLGGLHVRSAAVRAERVKQAEALFPILAKRRDQEARTMSGGEQRMLSIAIALMQGPELLMLDEPSLGIAPALTRLIFDTVVDLVRDQGLSVLVVEQNMGEVLRVADRVYVMRAGEIEFEETREQMLARPDYWDLF
jgi:branched-chain amino acid transport system ATP-binding protein